MADIRPQPKARHDELLEEKGVTHAEMVDMTKNLEARMRNPLEGISRDQLMRDVDAFAHQRGLEEHVALLRKGTLVAQNPAEARAIDGPDKLDADELSALEIEANYRWRMPARLFLTIATCSIGAAVQGWDQTHPQSSFPCLIRVGLFPKHYSKKAYGKEGLKAKSQRPNVKDRTSKAKGKGKARQGEHQGSIVTAYI